MSDSLLQACLRSLSQAHLRVYLSICMAYSPGLIHAAVSQSWGRNSSLSFSSPQNICASLYLCFRQRRFILPYVDAAISTTCCCMLHSLKNPSISHSSSLCVSLDFFFSSSLLCFWSEHPCLCLRCGFWIKVETRAVIRSLGDESAGRSPPFSSLPCQTCSHSSPQSERERGMWTRPRSNGVVICLVVVLRLSPPDFSVFIQRGRLGSVGLSEHMETHLWMCLCGSNVASSAKQRPPPCSRCAH